MGAYDAFRTLLNIRQRRRRPRAGFRPGPGTKVAMDDFRIVVQSGLSEPLWSFLVQAGFREMNFRPERRRYRDVPPSHVAKLLAASPDQWQPLLVAALKEAAKRPLVRVGPPSARVG